jgi:hypothetical protein
MTLPKPQHPIFTTKIPSIGQVVKFRGFTVKEEKTLLLAQETKDTAVIVEAIKAILDSCFDGKVKVSELAYFDVEYLISVVRSKSVGEVIELNLPCDVDVGHRRALTSIDISKVTVSTPEGHTKNILLYDDVGVIMRYPTIDEITKFEELDSLVSVAKCIESIYTNDEVFDAKDQTEAELVDFLSSLTAAQLKKIEDGFFKTMPSYEHVVQYKCPECGKEHKKLVKGLASFFV